MTMKKYNRAGLIRLITHVLLISGIISCQKDVDPILLNTGFTIMSSVVNAETNSGLDGVKIFHADTLLSVTTQDGKFTLKDLGSDTYMLRFYKEGFGEGFFKLVVADCDGYIPAIKLKPLPPPVVISREGGKVEAYYDTGKLAAELVIPPDAVDKNVNFYSTVLLGDEAPDPIKEENKIQGTTISFEADSEITLKGAELTFVLPYMLKPGDSIAINYFNKKEQKWELYKFATVEPDNITVTVEVDELTIYSIVLNGTYTELSRQKNSCQLIANSGNYLPEYNWNTHLKYLTPLPGSDATSVQEVKIFLNQLISMYSRMSFSEYIYVTLPKETTTDFMVAGISTPPLGNPAAYLNLTPNPWELVKHCCIIIEKVVLNIYDPNTGSYKDHEIKAEHLSCYYDWIWRANETYDFCSYLSCSSGNIIVPADDQHSGGSGK